MTLAVLRRFSIQKRCSVHFMLGNGMECVIDERGVARVPGLRKPPDFNLEDELTRAAEFQLEPVGKQTENRPLLPRSVTRAELSALASDARSPLHGEHEED